MEQYNSFVKLLLTGLDDACKQLWAMLLFLLTILGILRTGQSVTNIVDLGGTQYEGIARSDGITHWLGIGYAAPPVGDLRFAAPQDPPSLGRIRADHHGPLCLATSAPPRASDRSEDCLYLNIYAPTSIDVFEPLPVYFFIQGGGFNDLTNPSYDGAGLIRASNHSIIVVAINYRVGPYGFLSSSEVASSATASLNSGLLDQIQALKWVQKHISKFGGDPSSVTVGGDSAGAASISLLLTSPLLGGQDSPSVFHAAIAESVSFAPILTVEQSQYQYDNLVHRTGCSSASSTLDCLRSLPVHVLQNHNHPIRYPFSATTHPPLFMWDPVMDNSLITDYTYTFLKKGSFLNVPIIFGDDTNGGTIFTPRSTSTETQSQNFLRNQFPFLKNSHLEEIRSLYPRTDHEFPHSGPFWRQVSNAYGDMRYMCPTISISDAYSRHYPNTPNYGYRYNVEDPTQMRSGLGVPHTAEIHAIWGPEHTHGTAPQSYYPGRENDWIVPWMQGYITSFVRTKGDPNKYRVEGSPLWEEWSAAGEADHGGGRRMLFDKQDRTGMGEVDEEVMRRCEYLWSIGEEIAQ